MRKKDILELKAFSGDIPRIQSVFEEPCHLAAFIGVFLPFIYKVSFSNYKIVKQDNCQIIIQFDYESLEAHSQAISFSSII